MSVNGVAAMEHLTRSYLSARGYAGTTWHRLRNADHGEGVISAAIAVLIMAFLGAGMWLAFNTIFDNAATSTCEQTARIGGQRATVGDCSNLGAE